MKIKFSKGYSLLELIIVLGIVGIIISSISGFFIMNLKASKRADEQLEVQQQLQTTINIFADRLQNAISIDYNENINEEIYIIEYYTDVDSADTIIDQIILNKSNHLLMINGIRVGEYINHTSLIPLDNNGNELSAEEYDTIEKLNNILETVKMIKVQVFSQKGNTLQELSTTLFIRNM